MKKISICIMMLFLSATSFCQQSQPSSPLTREDYKTKSEGQKALGFILLGAGVTFVILSKGNSIGPHGPLAVVGTVAALGSIPLFIWSARNKRKALNASAFFKFDEAQFIRGTGICFKAFPAVSIKISL